MNGLSVDGVTIKPTETHLYSGSDTIRPGYAMCFDLSQSSANNREKYVTKPSWSNLIAKNGFAGIVQSVGTLTAAGRQINLIPFDGRRYNNVNVFTDENVAAGDLLGPIPDSYYFGRAVCGNAVFEAWAASDRSATAGLANGRFGPVDPAIVAAKTYRIFHDFDGTAPIFLGGATPAEFALPGLMVSGTSVGAQYTADAGGRLALTPNTTNIAQLNVGGIAAGTASTPSLLPITLSAGISCFFRARVNFGVGAVDNDVFCGLAIAGACVTDGTVPALDDYLGFYMQGDSSALINIATNRDNGTDNVTSTGTTQVADAVHDLAFLVRNRVSGDAAGATVIQVYVDGALTNTLSSAAVNALINKDEAMGPVFAGIGGASAVVIEIDRLEVVANR